MEKILKKIRINCQLSMTIVIFYHYKRNLCFLVDTKSLKMAEQITKLG